MKIGKILDIPNENLVGFISTDLVTNVPREIEKKEESASQKELLMVLVKLAQTLNTTLERQEKEVYKKIDRIDSNLDSTMKGLQVFQDQLSVSSVVALSSLERIEKRKPGSLLSEVDKMIVQKHSVKKQ